MSGPPSCRPRSPSLKNLFSLGPSEMGTDILALAATFEPRRLVAADVDGDDVSGMTYTGGTTGKPKGVMSSYRSGATLTQIQMAEWQWPEETRFLICTPLSHAGAAFFIPTLLQRRCAGGAARLRPRRQCSQRSRSTRSPRRCSCRR